MRKFYLLGSALLAILVFGALAATSAFALSEWLVEGVAPANGVVLNTESEGLLTLVRLISKTNSGILLEIDCEGVLDGTIENTATGGLDTTTAVLNLLMELINELGEAPELALSCTVTNSKEETADCLLNALAEVWPDNLYNTHGPWLTEMLALEEPSAGVFLVLDELLGKGALGEEPGYEIRCEAVPFDIIGEELCEGKWEFDLTNEPATLPAAVLVLTTIGDFTPEGECFNLTLGGEETEVSALEGDGNLWVTEGELKELATAIN